MDDILPFLLIIIFAPLLALVLFGGNSHKEFDDWAYKCKQDGGVVQFTGYNHNGDDHFECYKDGQIINHQE